VTTRKITTASDAAAIIACDDSIEFCQPLVPVLLSAAAAAIGIIKEHLFLDQATVVNVRTSTAEAGLTLYQP
jgi:hypothetical protein